MTHYERVFDTRSMEIWEIESARRSAAMEPLSTGEVDRILNELQRLTRERQQITTILDGLPASVHELRKALNELQRLVR